MYNTRPLPNHNQSIHPPALPSYLYSYLPAVWKLFNRPPTPTLVPVPSFSTQLSTTQKELLEPSSLIMAAQHSHTTDPTVSHGRGGECKSWAFNRSALTHFEQQVREMCSQIAPRKFLPSATICLHCGRLRTSLMSLAPHAPPPRTMISYWQTWFTTSYADGEITRQGRTGDQGDGAYSSGVRVADHDGFIAHTDGRV